MRSPNFKLTIILFVLMAGLVTLFVYCFLGKVATESYENMADCLYDCNWFEYPIDLQKCLIRMIQNTQQSLYYHGFDVAVLNLTTFSKVIFNKLNRNKID